MSHGSLQLLDLSDDLLFGILCTGYCGFTTKSRLNILLSCKTLWRIGSNLGLLRLSDAPDAETWSRRVAALINCLNVTCVDLAHCKSCELPPAFLRQILSWNHSLYGLNLRNTLIGDQSLAILFATVPATATATATDQESETATDSIKDRGGVKRDRFQQLRFLDLSKFSGAESALVTDEGLRAVCSSSCRQMRWLNLGMTAISSAGIIDVCKHMPALEYLSIPMCYHLTDSALEAIKDLSLVVLDMSYCTGLSSKAFHILFNNPYVQ
jgi:hypothetical protein